MSDLKLYGNSLIEGVSISGPKGWAAAVRNEDGDIIYRIKQERPARGGAVGRLIAGAGRLWQGLKWSARQVGETADEPLGFFTVVGSVLGSVILAALVFLFIPALASRLASQYFGPTLCCLIEGLLRVVFLLILLLRVSRFNDIKRLKGYNAAAHQAAAAYEASAELSPDGLRPFPLRDRRDALALVLSAALCLILIFSFVNVLDPLPRILVKLGLLLAAILVGDWLWRRNCRRPDDPLSRALLSPCLLMDSLLTRKPDPSQQEVAIAALLAVPDISGVNVDAARRYSASRRLPGQPVGVSAAAAAAYMEALRDPVRSKKLPAGASAAAAAAYMQALREPDSARASVIKADQSSTQSRAKGRKQKPAAQAAEEKSEPAPEDSQPPRDRRQAAASLMDEVLADLLDPEQAAAGIAAEPAPTEKEAGPEAAPTEEAKKEAGPEAVPPEEDKPEETPADAAGENDIKDIDESPAADAPSEAAPAEEAPAEAAPEDAPAEAAPEEAPAEAGGEEKADLGRRAAAAASALAATLAAGGREVGEGASRLADNVSKSASRLMNSLFGSKEPTGEESSQAKDTDVPEQAPADTASGEASLAEAVGGGGESLPAEAKASDPAEEIPAEAPAPAAPIEDIATEDIAIEETPAEPDYVEEPSLEEMAAAQAAALALAQAEAQAEADAEAARIRAEARARSEARRKAKAEAEEKAKARAEERARAEAEERAREEERAQARAEAKARAEAEERARAEAEERAREEAEEEANRSALREPADPPREEAEPLPAAAPPAGQPHPARTPHRNARRSGYRNGKYVERRPRPSQESSSRMKRIAQNIGLKVDRIYGDVEYYDPEDAEKD